MTSIKYCLKHKLRVQINQKLKLHKYPHGYGYLAILAMSVPHKKKQEEKKDEGSERSIEKVETLKLSERRMTGVNR